jgi:hypothetical protein
VCLWIRRTKIRYRIGCINIILHKYDEWVEWIDSEIDSNILESNNKISGVVKNLKIIWIDTFWRHKNNL